MGAIFLLFGFIVLIAAFILEGGAPAALLGVTPAMIVFGGVIGAVGLTTPASILKSALRAFPLAFKGRKSDLIDTIDYFHELSIKARHDGLLSLESELRDESLDPFIRFGLGLVVDSTQSESIRSILEYEIEAMSERHATRSKVFEAAGGYAPTMGIIGTVMGLVHVLGNLSDPASLGPLIAAAFLATLYGIASANLIFLPIGGRLKAFDAQEVMEKAMITEALISIVEGEQPALLKRKLSVWLDTQQQAELTDRK